MDDDTQGSDGEERLLRRAADAAFEPTHPVTAAGRRRIDGVEPVVRITDVTTGAVSDPST